MKINAIKTFGLCLTLFCLGLTQSLNAQSLKQFVPSTSTVVLGVNWANLEQKLSFSQISESKLGLSNDDPFMSLFIKILDNPKQYGLDLKEQSFYFHETGDTFNNQVLAVALNDRNAFISKVEEWLQTNEVGAKFKKSGSRHTYGMGNLGISCTNDMAIVLLGKKEHYYSSNHSDHDDFNYWSERRKVIREIDSFRYSDNDIYAEIMEAEEVEEEVDEMFEIEMETDHGDYDEEMVEAIELEATDAVEAYEVEDDYESDEIYYEDDEIEYEEDDIDIEYAVEDYDEDYDEYDYDRHPLMKALDKKKEAIEKKEREEFEKNQAVKAVNQIKRYMNLNAQETYIQNVRFNKVMDNTHDLSLWVNPEIFHQMYSGPLYHELLDRKSRRDTSLVLNESSFDRLMRGNFTYAHGDFNQGKFDMILVQERNKELAEFDYIVQEKVNPTMLKYINDETFGYMAANLNVTDFFESYRKVMHSMIESIPVKKEMTAMFELTDIFINKDIFYNTFSGDAVFALTGLKSQVQTKMKYVYDEETFDREYKEVTDTTLMPKVLCMAGIKKQENVDRLLLAFEHLGIFKKVKSNVYEIFENPEGPSTQFFVAYHNGILFVTNDETIVYKNLEGGLPKAEQLTGTGFDLLNKYGNCQYWDSQKSFEAILALEERHRPRKEGKIKVLQNHLSSGSMYSVRNGDMWETHAALNFTDSSINSLTELMNLLNELDVAR